MKPYPLIMNLGGKRVVVVGGGRVAHRKITNLLESGARVTVISPELINELRRLQETGAIEWVEERFQPSMLDDISDVTLIFGTTDDRTVNVEIFDAACDLKIPCNIADVPDLCTFIVPAVITQGDLLIAVSTGGSSPALARKIKDELSLHFGPEYAEMTRIMGELRQLVLQTRTASDENKALFTSIVESELIDALKENNKTRVLNILRELLPSEIDPEPTLYGADKLQNC